jgi:hypothetical protein
LPISDKGAGFRQDRQSLPDILRMTKGIGYLRGDEGITTVFPSDHFGP